MKFRVSVQHSEEVSIAFLMRESIEDATDWEVIQQFDSKSDPYFFDRAKRFAEVLNRQAQTIQ